MNSPLDQFIVPCAKREIGRALLKANFLKNVEVEAVILLFIIDFLSFWLLRQYRPGGQKRRENLNVN